jgi:ABC-type nitrate/sulfonate/bicarbonate transport system substrate-binding protein
MLRARRALFRFTVGVVVWAAVAMTATILHAEPLRIAYTSIAFVYGPLWLTKEAGLFKKYNIDAEFIYIAGGPPSLQALIAGDVAISFTAAGATVAANLQGSDVVLLGATIDSLPFEIWSAANLKEPAQLKGTRLGVSRIGATTDFIARYVLKKWNLQPDKDVAIFQKKPVRVRRSSRRSRPARCRAACCRREWKRLMPKRQDSSGSPMFQRRGWSIRLDRLPRAKRF